MPTQRFTEIPADALGIIETLAGPVLKAVTVSTGLNSEIAARIYNDVGAIVFVKGMRVDHPRVWTQEREASINPYVRPLAPAMLWHVLHGGWDLLCFEEIDGPHASYAPGSPHLDLVGEAVQTLASLPAPDLPLKTNGDPRRTGHPELVAPFTGCPVASPAPSARFGGGRCLHNVSTGRGRFPTRPTYARSKRNPPQPPIRGLCRARYSRKRSAARGIRPRLLGDEALQLHC